MRTIYEEFPKELIEQLGTNERLTREVCFSHGVGNANSQIQFYCTLYLGKRYKTTLEQKEQAKILYDLNVKKALKNIQNKLVFVGMGMEYEPRYKDTLWGEELDFFDTIEEFLEGKT